MAWKISWHLKCDGCKKTATFAGQPSHAVAKRAQRYGWLITPDFSHYCPTCAKSKSREDAVKSAESMADQPLRGMTIGW